MQGEKRSRGGRKEQISQAGRTQPAFCLALTPAVPLVLAPSEGQRSPHLAFTSGNQESLSRGDGTRTFLRDPLRCEKTSYCRVGLCQTSRAMLPCYHNQSIKRIFMHLAYLFPSFFILIRSPCQDLLEFEWRGISLIGAKYVRYV